MTPEERICEFMEPRPEFPRHWSGPRDSVGGWWRLVLKADIRFVWVPNSLSLDRLREVEERLILEGHGCLVNNVLMENRGKNYWIWHASDKQKITALASVLDAKGGKDGK